MIDLLLDVYKKECGIKNTLFKGKKFIYFILYNALYISLLGTVFLISMLFIAQLRIKLVIPILILSICSIVIILVFNRMVKKSLDKLYDFKSKKGLWYTGEARAFLFNIEKEKVNEYLEKENVRLPRLKYYKEKMEKESETLKPKLPVIPAICGALFVSLYNYVINCFTKFINTTADMSLFIAYNLVGILLVWLFLSCVKSTYQAIYTNSLFTRKYDYMKACIRIIEDIILDKEELVG